MCWFIIICFDVLVIQSIIFIDNNSRVRFNGNIYEKKQKKKPFEK